MREVQLVRSLNIERARVIPGREMTIEFREAVPVGKVNDYILAETAITSWVVPVHTFCKVVGRKEAPNGPGLVDQIETKYIAYSPEVEEFFGEPFRAFQEQLLAQSKQIEDQKNSLRFRDASLKNRRKLIEHLEPQVKNLHTAGFFRRLKFLFTGSL